MQTFSFWIGYAWVDKHNDSKCKIRVWKLNWRKDPKNRPRIEPLLSFLVSEWGWQWNGESSRISSSSSMPTSILLQPYLPYSVSANPKEQPAKPRTWIQDNICDPILPASCIVLCNASTWSISKSWKSGLCFMNIGRSWSYPFNAHTWPTVYNLFRESSYPYESWNKARAMVGHEI